MSRQTRQQRWDVAVQNAREKHEAAQTALAALVESLEPLEELRSEYENWRDSLPENASGGSTAELLDAVCELSFDLSESDSLDDFNEAIDMAEGVTLPRGYGRD